MNEELEPQPLPQPQSSKTISTLADIPEYRGLWSFLVGLLLAMVMRIQLMVPMNRFVSQDFYNQVFTMHGTTMIFLMAMPLLFGFSVYLTPLMIGAKDMAYPRLNAMGYWIYLFGSLMLYFSFVGGGAPAAGWFSYAPLTEKGFLFDPGITYWALSLLVMGIGSVGTGINLIVTIANY